MTIPILRSINLRSIYGQNKEIDYWNAFRYNIQIQLFLVQNTREIPKVASKRDEKKLATEYFERRWNLYFFPEKLHYGKE